MIDIHDRLVEQAHYAIRHHSLQRDDSQLNSFEQAKKFANEFLQTIPKLQAVSATDVQAAFDGDPAAANTDEIIFSYPGLFAISIYRLAHELHICEVL